METASTILSQLGGNKFLALTGSRNLRGSENSLVMDLSKNNLGAKFLTITLNGDDTYTMLFQSMRKLEIKVKSEIKGLYCDQLQSEFTNQTGLYTSF